MPLCRRRWLPYAAPSEWRETITRRIIVRNTIANALGVIVPAAVAIAATPLLVQALGTAEYGILSIQMAILVMLGVNDFGISRAIVLVSIGEGGFHSPANRIATAEAGLQLSVSLAIAIIVFGMLGCALTFAIVPSQPDVVASTLLTVLSAGISIVTLPLRASMEVEERFVILNIWRSVATSLLFGAPLLAALITPTLTAAAIGLLLSRIIVLAGYAVFAENRPIRAVGGAYGEFVAGLRRRHVGGVHKTLIRRGLWLGIAGLASTFIGYSDRFVLSVFTRATDVGHYVIASELVTKLWLVVGALTIAATPRLAAAWESGDPDSFDAFFRRFAGAIAATALASHLFLVTAGDFLLRKWLGSGFAPVITQIVHILSIGISLNCVSQANFTLVNIGRRERSAAAVQFVYLPITVVSLAVGIRLAGPVGAAWAFTARLVLDAFVIRWLVHKQIGDTDRHGVRSWQLGVLLGLLIAIYFVGELWPR